jgi:hypothetical protein
MPAIVNIQIGEGYCKPRPLTSAAAAAEAFASAQKKPA